MRVKNFLVRGYIISGKENDASPVSYKTDPQATVQKMEKVYFNKVLEKQAYFLSILRFKKK